MSDGTSIEWTDATWNVVNGCSVTSPGCTNCYAMRLAGTRMKNVESRKGLTVDSKAGPVWNGTTKFNEPVLLDPIRWKRPRRIFVCAHGDLFHESVPDAWIDRVFAVMAVASHHQFQVLTKRSARMRAYITAFETRPAAFGEALAHVVRSAGFTKQTGFDVIDEMVWPLENVWLGVSVEDQTRADERIPDLLATPAAVRWLSCEPLLGPVNIIDGMWAGPAFEALDSTIDWVVAGGESGLGARPMHPDWARSLRDQCEKSGVPFLFKQWGEWGIAIDRERDDPDWRMDYSNAYADAGRTRWLNLAGGCGFHGDRFHVMRQIGKKAAGRHLDGVTHDGFPA